MTQRCSIYLNPIEPQDTLGKPQKKTGKKLHNLFTHFFIDGFPYDFFITDLKSLFWEGSK